MDINLLVLNVGNSRLAIGVFEAGILRHVVRIPHERRDELPAAIETAWKRIETLENPSIAGASVNPNVMEAIEHIVDRETDEKIEWVGREIELPIKVLTDVPRETGIDRVLNVAAAYQQMQKACVVVDVGSAVTVDFCNDAGEFMGGAIGAGASMMLNALHERTAKLPLAKLRRPDGLFGKTTEQAIQHGVYYGIRGMVKELVENYATHLGSWPELIATGGDAVELFEGWELVHAISPDLTLYGIALAYVEHYIKQQG